MPNNLDQSEIRPLLATLHRFDVPIPAALATADGIAALATATRDAVLSEVEPDVSGLTVKNLADRVNEIATWQAMSAHRRGAATAVLSHAEKAQRDAWNDAVGELHGLLAPLFAEAAKRLNTATEQMGGETDMATNVASGRGETHHQATEAAADLTALMTARRILGGRLPSVDQPYWKWTQIAVLPSVGSAAFLDSAVRRGASGLKDVVEGELTWWANLARQDGITLKWHTLAEQIELREHLQPAAVQVGA